jgi:3-deoxy-D-manno-octulosonate 8-phosphate phosphatase (KDO 8-P phosphatase)
MPSAASLYCLASIELLVLDVDGVLTDGRVNYADDDREIKSFHVRDGSGIRFWLDAGKKAAIISGRASPAVVRRASELGISLVVQGATAKLPALRKILAELRLEARQACVIGDDLPDLPMVRNCGVGVAVADACPELRAEALYVTQKSGGRGAVREVVEMLLRAQNLWQPIVGRYVAERL